MTGAELVEGMQPNTRRTISIKRLAVNPSILLREIIAADNAVQVREIRTTKDEIYWVLTK